MPDDSKVNKSVICAMIVILAVMALLAIYANVQRLRREKLETVIVTPIATPTASPGSR